MSKRRIHYILSTHWDREWHRTFQEFRWYLVKMIDDVLAGFHDNSLHGPLQTDGQSIIIEDYLEIRPEKRTQIFQLAQQHKLIIGPWYCMPDEFTVSGESLIRNLRMGRELANSLGGTP